MTQSSRFFTISILSILMWVSNFSLGFGQTYVKFIEKGKVWETTMSGGGMCGQYTSDLFFIADDTLINGTSYSKLKIKSMYYPSSSTIPWGCVAIPLTTSSVFAYIREDTIAHKVYEVLRNNTSWNEGLYMDFSLSVGDSVPFGRSRYRNFEYCVSAYPLFKGDTILFYLTVDQVDTSITGILPNNKGSKRIRFKGNIRLGPTSISGWNSWTEMEGIGGSYIPSGFYINLLPEYSQSITRVTYNNKVTNGELVLGLESDSDLDPNKGLLPDDFTQLDIYDAKGVHITTIYDKETFTGFCASPPSGMLVLRTTSRHSVSVKKVVFCK